MRGLVLVVALGATAGCVENLAPFDPEVGRAIQDRCADIDSDLDNDVSFSEDIEPILRGDPGPVGCGCHFPGNANPIGLQQAGLDLSSYDSLRAGGLNSRSNIVVPGSPCTSVLWQKISEGPPFGARMPFSGPPFLTSDQQRLIADWIAEGAREN